jgi:anti-sigma B factor antagonist
METDGTMVLVLAVESLDRLNVGEFREEAAKAVAASSGRVAVDCSILEFLDSSGLGAFLHVHNLLPEERRPVVLAGVGPKVLTILELMQVHRLFEMQPRA